MISRRSLFRRALQGACLGLALSMGLRPTAPQIKERSFEETWYRSMLAMYQNQVFEAHTGMVDNPFWPLAEESVRTHQRRSLILKRLKP